MERISTQQSVSDMAGKLNGWLGNSQRAERTSGKVDDENFDSHTGQIEDVIREELPDGTTRYVAIMFDARGREFHAELEPEGGASIYRAVQLAKSNPLTEMVYRKIILSMLDDLLRPSPPEESEGRSP
jgi:hypothetical protein